MNNTIKSFKTIRNPVEYKLKEKNSIFIGKAYPISRESDVEKTLKSLKKEFYNASHHCFGYKLIDGSFRFSDSGEPSGTAGARILNAIEHFDLNNVLVVVIRYFGGTKLGVSLLGKTYYNSVLKVLESSELITKHGFKKIVVSFTFDQSNLVYKILSQFEGKVSKENYGDLVSLECKIKIDVFNSFVKTLKEVSRGKVLCKINDKIIYE